KDGRSGRSMSRQARMAASVGRPSRRKKLPGMRPAAYIRSSTSTVSGKKSMPSRTLLAAFAVTRASVPSRLARTAPWLWKASFPVSKVRVLSVPLIGVDTVMASAMVVLLVGPGWAGLEAAGPVPSWQPPERAPGDRQLAADPSGPPRSSLVVGAQDAQRAAPGGAARAGR